ncbi:MAG TPA: alpha/beta hydrolase, partial [Microthrixaceae bacterium]|nr:alpha/beta hydrolase [Microthrixaceae bacterium]
MTVTLRHGRIDLALHKIRRGDGRALLLLHGLGEATPAAVPAVHEAWRGPVWGLDFTGHGDSTVPVGGGYTAEILLGDADAAIRHLGEATVVGRGLGAWIALQLVAARPGQVIGAVLSDGPGLIGGGIQPGSPFVVDIGTVTAAVTPASPDPFALIELARDVRPADYGSLFVRFALEGSELAEPIVVSAVSRPEWLAAAAAEPGVIELPLP